MCKHYCMTTVLSVRIEKKLAERAAKAARGNLSAFVREAIAEKVKDIERRGNDSLRAHIEARAGTWDGFVSGEELLRRTRP